MKLLLRFGAIAARAGDLEDGLAAYVKQKYPAALQKFRRAAGQGSANAQLGLGVMYLRGQGVAADPVVALRWYRLAAQQGLEEGSSWYKMAAR